MARPRKKGLSYFPLDVDVFQDEKLFDLQNEYGPLGEAIYLRILCMVYKNGYYFEFKDVDHFAALIVRSIGSRWARDKKTVKEVILYLAKINLFSAELMQRNVITSRSIQERYLIAVGRRRSEIVEYNLLEKSENPEGFENAPKNRVIVTKTPVIATETPVSVAETPINKIKENKKYYYYSGKKLNLTIEQHKELCDEFGEQIVENKIAHIVDWQDEQNRVIKDPYSLIRQWIINSRVEKHEARKPKAKDKNKETSYDLDEWEQFAKNFDPEVKE